MKMPILTRDHLAVKLRQNWVAKHGHEAGAMGPNLDDSLTSLNWLQNLNIMKITTPTPPPSPQHMLESAKGDMKVNPNSVLNVTNIHPPRLDFHKAHLADVAPSTASTLDKIDYKKNPYIKPPYSYATLICMAMRETKKSKITLSAIYNWITENFMYYRMADPSWQNSIRHNLSLNKCFQKVPRRKDEPGKGGFWRINPEYSDMFVNGIFKKRRTSARENIQPVIKRIKKEPEEDSSSNSSLCSFASLQRPIKIKTEADGLDANRKYRSMLTGEELNNSDILRGDFSWNSLLNQDIDVGGVKIKTEDIINGTDEVIIDQNPMVGMSPPPSDGNSESGLDDFWAMDFNESAGIANDTPLDLSTNGGGDPLDLTIQGVGIRPPDGWAESFNGMNGVFGTARQRTPSESSGLHTPVAPSPINDGMSDIDFSHPWAENRLDLDEAIAAFDVDNLFDVDNIPSPRI